MDTQALIAALQTRRIYAVLDVYEEEGAGNQPEALLQCRENTLLLPHIAAAPATWQLTQPLWTISAASCAANRSRWRFPCGNTG